MFRCVLLAGVTVCAAPALSAVRRSKQLECVRCGDPCWFDPRLPYGVLLRDPHSGKYESYLLVPPDASSATPPEPPAERDDVEHQLQLRWEAFIAFSFYAQLHTSESRNDNDEVVRFEPPQWDGLWGGANGVPLDLYCHLEHSPLAGEAKEGTSRLGSTQILRSSAELIRVLQRHFLPLREHQGGAPNQKRRTEPNEGDATALLEAVWPRAQFQTTVADPRWDSILPPDGAITARVSAYERAAVAAATPEREAARAQARERRKMAVGPRGGDKQLDLTPTPPATGEEEAEMWRSCGPAVDLGGGVGVGVRAGAGTSGGAAQTARQVGALPTDPASPWRPPPRTAAGAYRRSAEALCCCAASASSAAPPPAEARESAALDDGGDDGAEEVRLDALDMDVTVLKYPFKEALKEDFYGLGDLDSSVCYSIYVPGSEPQWYVWFGCRCTLPQEDALAAFHQCGFAVAARSTSASRRTRTSLQPIVVLEGEEPDELVLALD